MPTEGKAVRPDDNEIDVDPVRMDAYLKGLAAGRSEVEAECERRVAQAREELRIAQFDASTAVTERDMAVASAVARAREGYWPADDVLEALRTETDFYEGKVGGSQEKQDGYALGFYEAADFLERRFSGEGAS